MAQNETTILRTPHGYEVFGAWGRLQQALRDAAWRLCMVGCHYGPHPYDNPCDNCIAAGCADVGWWTGQPIPERFADAQ